MATALSFFFSSRRRHTRCSRDWSSDVCSSDLKIAFGLGLPSEVANSAIPFLQSLHRAFIDTDASMLEINPCVLTGDGKLVALDAKMTFDDNALFRHKDLRELRDLDEEDPLEVEAS